MTVVMSETAITVTINVATVNNERHDWFPPPITNQCQAAATPPPNTEVATG
jgi:hypothetical protein